MELPTLKGKKYKRFCDLNFKPELPVKFASALVESGGEVNGIRIRIRIPRMRNQIEAQTTNKQRGGKPEKHPGQVRGNVKNHLHTTAEAAAAATIYAFLTWFLVWFSVFRLSVLLFFSPTPTPDFPHFPPDGSGVQRR